MSTLRVRGPALRAFRRLRFKSSPAGFEERPHGLEVASTKHSFASSPAKAGRSSNGAHRMREVLLEFRRMWAE